MLKVLINFARWLIGGFFFLLALATALTETLPGSFFALLLGLVITPLADRYLFSKLKTPLPPKTKAMIGAALFIAFTIALPPAQSKNELPPEPNTTVESSEIQSNQNSETYYQVTGVTDGDTIKVVIDGKTETVRLANIDTPETVDPRQEVGCFGQEASDKMKELVSNKSVSLQADETQSDRDRYDRLIRFVFLEDETDVGLIMIREGFAQSSPYGNAPHKYFSEYQMSEQTASDQQKGLWSPTACPTPTPTATPTRVPTPTARPIPTATPTPKPQVKPAQPVNSGSGGGSGNYQAPPAPAPAVQSSGQWACDCSKTCPQMSSCAEAQYQLNTCGCSQRDRDKDGLACDDDCG